MTLGGIDGPEVRDIGALMTKILKQQFLKSSLCLKNLHTVWWRVVFVHHTGEGKTGKRPCVKEPLGLVGKMHILQMVQTVIFGVADGIFEWRERGIDAGEFSRALITGASEYVLDANRKISSHVEGRLPAAAKHTQGIHTCKVARHLYFWFSFVRRTPRDESSRSSQ